MPLKLGFQGVAHMHAYSYASCAKGRNDVHVVGVWDRDPEKSAAFAQAFSVDVIESADALCDSSDAVVIACENKRHAEDIETAARHGCAILCEKPLVTDEAEAGRAMAALKTSGVRLMTAFPCRFSPAFSRLKQLVSEGAVGPLRALRTTNRGSCPFGWFVQKEHSGGGAMIDHTVHVADLLRDLLQAEPTSVFAQIGSNLYGQDWEDTAMVTLTFPGGIFATLDSSWSRPKSYKTWGDVTISAVGDSGVVDLDMFGPGVEVFAEGPTTHRLSAYGSNLDALLLDEFVASIRDDREPLVTAKDGLQAARIAMAAYRSVESGRPEPVRSDEL